MRSEARSSNRSSERVAHSYPGATCVIERLLRGRHSPVRTRENGRLGRVRPAGTLLALKKLGGTTVFKNSLQSAPLTDIAYSVGFKDPAHFSRMFEGRYGSSPRGFRARLADMP